MESLDSDNITNLSTGDIQGYSDNISFNSSSISCYSAEEQIIQQRGRRSPQKSSYNEQHFIHQQQTQYQSVNTRELFINVEQSSMRSPDSKAIYYKSNRYSPNNSIDSSNSLSLNDLSSLEGSCRKSRRNLNKSLIRSPVKRRLRLRRSTASTIKKPRRRA